MAAVVVVVIAPVVEHAAHVAQAGEPVLRQAFVPEAAVEAFDVGVLGRLAGLDERDQIAFLGVGKNGWTLPIPIVKSAAGWQFDTQGAADEMRIRRIGRNELAAIQVALAYTDAHYEYRARDWDGDSGTE